MSVNTGRDVLCGDHPSPPSSVIDLHQYTPFSTNNDIYKAKDVRTSCAENFGVLPIINHISV